jgi:hypothetical protein
MSQLPPTHYALHTTALYVEGERYVRPHA